MGYILLQVNCPEEKRELLIAELSLFPFDAFEETEDGLLASCEEELWSDEGLDDLMQRYNVPYSLQRVEKVNWNEEWEKNYEPVIISDQCIVRATFHQQRPEFPYEIIITPKMSFGTGHHATTHQVLQYQLDLDHLNKRVLDVGCGTGALAIMAHKRGAETIDAVDIDEWCVENSLENFSLNDSGDIKVRLGGIELIENRPSYDIILANINKNVLMDQMKDYVSRLKKGGILVISGFYNEDIPELMHEAKSNGLVSARQSEMNRWAMLAFKKA